VIYHTHGTPDWTNTTYDSLVDLEATVDDALRALVPVGDQFDCFVVTGMSGVIVGVPLALRMGKPVIILRREDDKCHQSAKGWWMNDRDFKERCLFLDDFIGMGATIARVERAVGKAKGFEWVNADNARHFQPRIVGTYLYRDNALSLYSRNEMAVA
jgi:adenine/guanine phosphoribosyltransferase-like PRPP-binding protein